MGILLSTRVAALGTCTGLQLRGDVEVSMLVLDSLLAVISWGSVDPGAATFPAYVRPQTAQHNAGTALVRLCSDPATSVPSVPREHGVSLPEGGNLRSLVEIAMGRLERVLEAGAGATSAHEAMKARLTSAYAALGWGSAE
eukprot:COSAG02_NODE_7196_length_3125_cov_1.842697_1_plen_141_part_00